jgi:leucyl-tRNA synthetase
MSKNKGNVVSPDDMIARYGADATRMYSLFAAPPDRDLDWQEDGVAGISRFLSRVYRFITRYAARVQAPQAGGPQLPAPLMAEILRKLHQTIAKVSHEFGDRWHFNTAIAAIMELVNHLVAAEGEFDRSTGDDATLKQILDTLVLLLAPLAPYFAAEMWATLGHAGDVLRVQFPIADSALAAEDTLEVPVQINGKLRAVIKLPIAASKEEMLAAALAEERVAAGLAGKERVREIVVPGKLVNLVVK